MKEYDIEMKLVFEAKDDKDALLQLSNYFLNVYNENEEKENEFSLIVGGWELKELNSSDI